MATFTRADVLRYRIQAQQLNRPVDAGRALTDAVILDFGVQDTGTDSASWSLANRGVPIGGSSELAPVGRLSELALVWTLRASPHYYRRADLADVRVATSPTSDADVGKRIFDANRPLKAAGIGARDALAEVARQMHAAVKEPIVKGELSTRMTRFMPVWCKGSITGRTLIDALLWCHRRTKLHSRRQNPVRL